MCLISFNPSLEVHVMWHHHKFTRTHFSGSTVITLEILKKNAQIWKASHGLWRGILESNFICIMPDIWGFTKQLCIDMQSMDEGSSWGKKTKSFQPSFQLPGEHRIAKCCLAHWYQAKELAWTSLQQLLVAWHRNAHHTPGVSGPCMIHESLPMVGCPGSCICWTKP